MVKMRDRSSMAMTLARRYEIMTFHNELEKVAKDSGNEFKGMEKKNSPNQNHIVVRTISVLKGELKTKREIKEGN